MKKTLLKLCYPQKKIKSSFAKVFRIKDAHSFLCKLFSRPVHKQPHPNNSNNPNKHNDVFLKHNEGSQKIIPLRSLRDLRYYIRLRYPVLGLTGLAAELNITYPTLNNTLAGSTKKPEVIFKLCTTLAISHQDIPEWRNVFAKYQDKQAVRETGSKQKTITQRSEPEAPHIVYKKQTRLSGPITEKE